MRKMIIWVLVLLSIVVLLIRYSSKIGEILLNVKTRGGVSILSSPLEANVYLDGKEVGKTPFEDKNLDVKQYKVKIDKDGKVWQGLINLNPQTVTVINRDLAYQQASSSGEILTLDKGRGITVISNPTASDVEIDGKMVGKTPISVNIESGEHTILLSHSNYFKRSIKVILPSDFNLTVSVDLALSEADLTSISAPVVTQTQEVKVLSTPTGFLRLRDQASLNGKEIGKVNVGEKLILLEELSGWMRVRLTNGTEGFVSSTYVEKVKD